MKLGLYFLFFDSPFYWVRASALSRLEDRVEVRKLFKAEKAAARTVFVFSRFGTTLLYRLYHKLCLLLGVPYIVDVDDLFWDLPAFSVDAARDPNYVRFMDRLIEGASLVTTSCAALQIKLKQRYPSTPSLVVENCPPLWFAPQGAVLVANSDAFKMQDSQVQWFAGLLDELVKRGHSVQLLGNNAALERACRDTLLYACPYLRYSEYLRLLAQGGFRVGLLPVDGSTYADCKSAVKAIEFSTHGMAVIASAIEPYREFKSRYPGADIRLVPNEYAEWKSAVDAVLADVPCAELEQGIRTNELLIDARARQEQGWQAVLEFFEQQSVPEQKGMLVSWFMRTYTKIRDLLRAPSRLLNPPQPQQ